MTLRPELAAAYEQLDAAVTALLAAKADFPDDSIVTGYTLVVAGVRFDDNPEPGYDEQETVSDHAMFCKRGQSPTLTRGMLEYSIDYLRYGAP